MFTQQEALQAYANSLSDMSDLSVWDAELIAIISDGLPIHDGRLSTSLPPCILIGE